MRGSPLLTGLAGVALTLGLALWLDVRAAQQRTPPASVAPEPATVRFGEPGSGELVSPLERHVLAGEAQWSPLLLQLGDPDFLAADKLACISRFGSTPEDAPCRVEYTWSLASDGRVRGIEALVLPGVDSACLAYVECRLPGLAKTRLELPPGEPRAGGLRILDKVTHAQQRHGPEDERREVSQLTALLAAPDHPELAQMPAAAQRLQNYLRQTQARRLAALQRREQAR